MHNEPPTAAVTGSTRILSNRYLLRHSLGRGTFGEVYYAEDTKFEPSRVVAVKLLNSQFTADAEVREDIKREASALARFSHPNILRVVDFEVSQDLAYIVTDIAEGGSLAKKLRPDSSKPPIPLSLEDTARYLEQIANALDEAHAVGLLHRDIKPLNILLDKRDRPMLADFGLATALSGSASSIMVDTTSSGTPLYMAPEQWRGQVGKVSDIYALGIVVFQLITGEPPFIGNQAALAWQHMNAPVPPLRDRAPWLKYHPRLDEVIAKALAKDPLKRTRPAEEFYKQFREALDLTRSMMGTRALAIAPEQYELPPLPPLTDATPELPVSTPAPKIPERTSLDNPQRTAMTEQLARLETQGEWEAAIKLGERLLQLDSKNLQTRARVAKAYHMRGMNFWLSDDYDKAVQNYTQAIELDPTQSVYYSKRGKCYFDKRDYYQSVLDFDRAIELDPGNTFCYYWRGMCYLCRHEYDAALKDFNFSIELDPYKTEYYHCRGLAYKGAGERAAARADFHYAMDLGHPVGKSELEKMDAEDSQQQREEQARQIGDLVNRIYAAKEKADWDTAIELGEIVLKLDANYRLARLITAEAYANRGVIYNQENNYDAAAMQFTRAIEIDPQTLDYYLMRGKSYAWKGDYERAIADLTRAVLFSPQKYDYYLERGRVYNMKGDTARAEADFAYASQLRANQHWELGKNFVLKGDHERAIVDFTRAIQFDSQRAMYYHSRGTSYLKVSEFERAVSDFSKAIELDPAQAGYYHYFRGMAYKQRGDKKNAKRDLQRAVELGHKDARLELKGL